MGEGGLGQHDLQEPPPTSIEAFFHATGQPRAILDLRLAEDALPAAAWLLEPRPFRSIGAMAMTEQFSNVPVTERFEVLIYIDRTDAAIQNRP